MTKTLSKSYVEHAKRVEGLENILLETLEEMRYANPLETIIAVKNILGHLIDEYAKMDWPPFEE